MEQSNEYVDAVKKMQSDISDIGRKSFSSTNYFYRFISFLVFTQLLFLFLFIMVRLFGWFGWFKLIPYTILICFGIGFVFLILLLFRSIKARALSFFASGIIYLGLSLLGARTIGTDISLTDMTFMGGWSAWNMVFSVIILMIGTLRTFLLGFVHDYKK